MCLLDSQKKLCVLTWQDVAWDADMADNLFANIAPRSNVSLHLGKGKSNLYKMIPRHPYQYPINERRVQK